MSELILTVIACFGFLAFGAWIGIRAQKQVMQPFLDLIQYMVKHVAAHDLQVYHGISEVDRNQGRPFKSEQRGSMGMSPEDLAIELERMNGDLPPTAE